MESHNRKDFGDTRNQKTNIGNLVYGKVPPQAPELEKAIIGAMLLDKSVLPEVLPIIPHAEVFYVDAHQKIYDAAIKTQAAGSPIDTLTIGEQLRKDSNLEIVGGFYYLAQLANDMVTGAHAVTHARIVVEKYIQREIIRVCGSAIGEAYEDSTDPFELLQVVEKGIHEAGQIVSNGRTVHISQAGKECVELSDRIRNNEISQGGLSSGIKSIDEVTGGWQKTDFIVIAARPAVGKTAFVLNMMLNCNAPCLIFSLEMGQQQLYKRMAANTASIPLDYINSPKRMNDYYHSMWQDELVKLSKTHIYINDKAGMTTTEMRAIVADYKRKYRIEMVVLDYIQLAKAALKRNGNREQEIAQITRDLKCMAKDFEIPVIALSQLNRGIETRASNKPTLSDLRESGAIEQDADLVCFLYGSSDEGLKGVRNFDIAKHRNGVTRDMLLKFQGEFQRFTDNEPDIFKGTQVYETQGDKPRAGIKPNYAANFQTPSQPFTP